MKNRKTFIGIALLIVALLIGIGYAAVTQNLTIKGTATATADDDNFTVVFTGTTSNVSDGVTAEAEADSTSATMDVTGLSTKGDSASATFTIQNKSDELKATVAATTKTITKKDGSTIDPTEYFAVNATVADETALDPNATTTVTVTVSLIKTPAEDVDGTINVELTATAVAAD